YLYGETRTTARGRKMAELWEECAEAEAAADDPRVAEIRALIAEERAALAEEDRLLRRREEMEIEQPENTGWPGLHPLGEEWQRAALGIERLDRQINAKIRLLIRLEKRAQSEVVAAASSPPVSNNNNRRPEAAATESTAATQRATKIRGTKPSDPLESITEPIVIASYTSHNDPAAPSQPGRAAGSTAPAPVSVAAGAGK
ncbi:MAG: hypothetical protein ACRD19_14240, partial [Terriglobia bacterium]